MFDSDDGADSDDDDIFVYNKATLTQWKEDAIKAERKKKQEREHKQKRANDRRLAKAEIDRVAKVSVWRTGLRRDRHQAVSFQAKKDAAARALEAQKELERQKRAADAKQLKMQARDEVLLEEALKGHAITRRALMLKARHDTEDEV